MTEGNELTSAKDYLLEAVIKTAALNSFSSGDHIIELVNRALGMGLPISDQAVAHYVKGSVFYQQDKLSNSENELILALEIDPRVDNSLMCFCVWETLASIQEQRGNTNNAIRHLKLAIGQVETLYGKNDEAIASIYCALASRRNSRSLFTGCWLFKQRS
jgi:tetratricopeptide (TPR) repeat protein